jgi:hypothetical protein
MIQKEGPEGFGRKTSENRLDESGWDKIKIAVELLM